MVTLMSLKELLPVVEHVSILSVSDAIETRRRPGRLKKVSPDLVPLLRSPTTADISKPFLGEMDAQFTEDNLASVKGIMFAVVLSGALWVAIGYVIWTVLS